MGFNSSPIHVFCTFHYCGFHHFEAPSICNGYPFITWTVSYSLEGRSSFLSGAKRCRFICLLLEIFKLRDFPSVPFWTRNQRTPAASRNFCYIPPYSLRDSFEYLMHAIVYFLPFGQYFLIIMAVLYFSLETDLDLLFHPTIFLGQKWVSPWTWPPIVIWEIMSLH